MTMVSTIKHILLLLQILIQISIRLSHQVLFFSFRYSVHNPAHQWKFWQVLTWGYRYSAVGCEICIATTYSRSQAALWWWMWLTAMLCDCGDCVRAGGGTWFSHACVICDGAWLASFVFLCLRVSVFTVFFLSLLIWLPLSSFSSVVSSFSITLLIYSAFSFNSWFLYLSCTFMHWSEQLSQPTHRLQWYHNWVFHHPEVPREVLQLCDSWPLPPCRNSGGIQPAGIVLSVFWNTDSFSVDRKSDEWGRWYPASRNRIVSNRCEGQSVVNDMHVISVPEPVWIRLLSSLWEKCDLCRSYYCPVSAWARAKETGWYWHSVYCVRCRLFPDNQLVSNSLDFLLFKNLLAPPHFPAFRSAHCSLCSALNDDNTDVKEEKLATSLDTIELLWMMNLSTQKAKPQMMWICH